MSVLKLKAQQNAIYSQISNAHYHYNPAFVGLERNGILTLSHRNQWTGIKDAPTNQVLSYSTRLKKSWIDTISPNALPLSNNHLYNPQKRAIEKTKMLPIGIGISVNTDESGPFQRFNSKINLAYHTIVNKKINFSYGLGYGISYLDIKVNKLWVLEDGDDIYNEYRKENSNELFTNANMGLALYNKKFYVAYAASQAFIKRPFYDSGDVSDYRLRTHHILSGAYIYKPNKTIEISPSANLFKVAAAPISYTLGIKLRYKTRYWIGLNYRVAQAISARAGLLISNRFAVNYAYELSSGPIIKYQFGTHEIGISYLFNYTKPLKHLW